MLSGFWYGARRFAIESSLLWIRCILLLVLALMPFMFADNLTTMAIALVIAGLAIAPTSISGQVLTEQTLPTAKMNEGMSIIVTAMILGMAIGSWLAGLLIDKLGTNFTGIMPFLAVCLALFIANIGFAGFVS
jgi:predicted MFS family arabinose efflux permease